MIKKNEKNDFGYHGSKQIVPKIVTLEHGKKEWKSRKSSKKLQNQLLQNWSQ